MVTAEKSIAVKAPIEKVFKTVCDFESYPDFLSEIEKAQILKKTGKSTTVSFRMNMMQTVNYTLKFNLNGPDGITWTFVEGDDILKDNSGFWKLVEIEPGLVDLTYHINVDFNIWLPGSLVQSLLDDHLPKMLSCFKIKIEG